MLRYGFYTILLLVVVGVYLLVRSFIDRKVEKATNTEVVRKSEEFLGSWASKSASGLIMFRLHRDGKFTYTLVKYPGNDSIKINGHYQFVEADRWNDVKYFPRLYTFNEKGDTVFNYYVRYYTKYNSTIDKVDKLILSPNGVLDTISYTYYRIKQ